MTKPRLFLIHFAGGNVYSYLSLKPYLPDFEFIALELPGRGKRMREKLTQDFNEAARDICAQIMDKAGNAPFMIFGHSMGSLLGFKASQLLANAGRPPVCLVTGGNPGPGIQRPKGRYLLGSSALKEELRELGGVPEEVLENEELFGFFEPVLRADFEIAETQSLDNEPPLPLPICALMGSGEEDAGAINNWARFSGPGFSSQLFEGGHFFIFNHYAEVAKVIRRCAASTQAWPQLL